MKLFRAEKAAVNPNQDNCQPKKKGGKKKGTKDNLTQSELI